MLDGTQLGVDLDDHFVTVNGRREHPILLARILLGHASKFTPLGVGDDEFRNASDEPAGHFIVQRDLPQALAHTPNVISQTVDATGWSKLAEITVD
jgi:hypothetical protein